MRQVSIIVLLYNAVCYLKMRIDSIINSTYRNLQIILVDDGSTDTFATICARFSACRLHSAAALWRIYLFKGEGALSTFTKEVKRIMFDACSLRCQDKGTYAYHVRGAVRSCIHAFAVCKAVARYSSLLNKELRSCL